MDGRKNGSGRTGEIDRAVPCQVRFSRPPVLPFTRSTFRVSRAGCPIRLQPPSGLRFRPSRETSAVRSHAAAHATGPSGFGARGGRCGRCVESVLTSPRDGSKLGGQKDFGNTPPKPRRFDLTPSRSARNGAFRVRSPWRVVADAAWNRFCTSRRDGRRLGGRKDFGNTPPNRRTRNVADVKSGSPVLPSSRSPVPRSASRGRVAQFVSSPLLVCDSGLHAKPRRFDLTPSRRARNGAFRVRSPWRSLQTLRGIGSARLAEMAAGSGGEKTSATRPRIVEPGTLQMSSPVLPSSRPPVLPFSRQPDYEKSRWVSS